MALGETFGSLLGQGPLGGLLGDPFGQRQMTDNERANQQLIQGQQQDLQRQMGFQSDPFHMQGLQLGGQGIRFPFRMVPEGFVPSKSNLVEIVKEESLPWDSDTVFFLAMAATAIVVYPVIKLILGVL